jgi:hypothetical protein
MPVTVLSSCENTLQYVSIRSGSAITGNRVISEARNVVTLEEVCDVLWP